LLALTPVLKTALVIISLVLVAVIGVGLLVYFKRRKGKP
jgi:hypothetical protein